MTGETSRITDHQARALADQIYDHLGYDVFALMADDAWRQRQQAARTAFGHKVANLVEHFATAPFERDAIAAARVKAAMMRMIDAVPLEVAAVTEVIDALMQAEIEGWTPRAIAFGDKHKKSQARMYPHGNLRLFGYPVEYEPSLAQVEVRR